MSDPQTCEILLVRHALTDWNLRGWHQGHRDVPLSDTGRAMLPALVGALACRKASAVYSSDLSRARETAEAIARPRGVSVRIDPRLRERRRKEPHPSDVYPILRWPVERESDEQIVHRMRTCLEEIAARHVGECVIVVGHGGSGRAFLRDVFGLTPMTEGRSQHTSIQHLAWSGEAGWRAVRLDDCDHLAGTDSPATLER